MYRRVLFIGSKALGLAVLKLMHELSPETLIGCVTIDDSDDGRSELEAIKGFCEDNSVPYEVLSGRCDITGPIDRFMPDLCFVVGWYHIIPENLLGKVSGGFIGIHDSLLPSHRGFAPVVWAMIAGEKETGFSVFSFDRGMDTGKIWYQEKVGISENDYVSDVLAKLEAKTEGFFRNHYRELTAGELRPKEQESEGVSYGAMRTPDDGLIDWREDARTIRNFIRAQSQPYPGAFTFYRGEKLTILRADVFPYPIQGSPGQIGMIDPDDGSVVVVCGKNTGIRIPGFSSDDGKEKTVKIRSLKDRLG
ncbi:MAG: methionyl-tRNA formyltransferase [Lachnospiraceae bacterium]|nr:methionyl-tRNA formyltransferase [Lachnospiraceae bacterium]